MTRTPSNPDSLFPEHEAQELVLARELAELLEKHYPGYLWAVNVTLHGGMATIQALALSGEWGCYVPLARILNDPQRRYVVQCGGELLERYRVHRGQIDIDQVASLQKDRFNNYLVDKL